MSDATALLLDLTGVARLADVRRPVVSMWRTRFADGDDPFPAPVKQKNGRPLFAALEVAHWLERTNHGNNRDAVADAAASATPAGFDLTDSSHVASVDALLTLRAITSRPVGGDAFHDAGARARLIDPHDASLLAEIERAEPEWAAWADELADAAYSPLGAAHLIATQHAATRSSAGSDGPLTADGLDVVVSLVAAVTGLAGADIRLRGGIDPMIASTMLHLRGDAEILSDATEEGRRIRRRLLCEGVAAELTATRSRPVVEVVRLSGTVDASTLLRTLDELSLSLADGDRAIILGPANLLIEPLASVEDGIRADVLRSGRVRAITRLPTGLVVTAPRETSGLWVLGPPVGDVPISERFTAVADLIDHPLTPAARGDLTSDVVAAMGSSRDVRAHAFRFARLIRTTSLLASRGSLVAGASARLVPEDGPAAGDLPALIDAARDSLGADAPSQPLATGRASVLDPVRLESLRTGGHLRIIAGTRVDADEFTDRGLVAVTADDLGMPDRIGARRIDPLEFAARHPSARLTSPGDVVFRTSPAPQAWVDAQGSSVVAYPARVLRINSADPGGLVPEVVAADIASGRAGAGAWRRWMLRRVAPSSIASLRAALADISSRRAALTRRLEALDRYSDLLTAGVVSGAVTLPDPAADAASDPQ